MHIDFRAEKGTDPLGKVFSNIPGVVYMCVCVCSVCVCVCVYTAIILKEAIISKGDGKQ